MSLTGPVALHPAEYSPEVIMMLRTMVQRGECIHDPFAGRGIRLGLLAYQMGCSFSGTDIEHWPQSDRRVAVGDATDASTYPSAPFTVITSPVYANRISTDYVDGPTPNTKANGRRAYGISLGRPLHPSNLARLARHPAAFYAEHLAAVVHWDARALVNVDLPMSEPWQAILSMAGYTIKQVMPVQTRRYRGVANSERRPAHEVIIEGYR